MRPKVFSFVFVVQLNLLLSLFSFAVFMQFKLHYGVKFGICLILTNHNVLYIICVVICSYTAYHINTIFILKLYYIVYMASTIIRIAAYLDKVRNKLVQIMILSLYFMLINEFYWRICFRFMFSRRAFLWIILYCITFFK